MSAFGPKLPLSVYNNRLMDLHTDRVLMPTEASETLRRHTELNLRVDHLLGLDFPQSRRQALWELEESLDDWKEGLSRLWAVLRSPFSPRTSLLQHTLRRFHTVLSAVELSDFFAVPLPTVQSLLKAA